MAKSSVIDDGGDGRGNGGHVVEESMSDALSRRYLAYAMSTITARALPDVRDGLKPVHRRVLYSMAQLGLTATGPFRKSATVVGEVIGKYHPHGDQSIYDALVRLAQDFNTRHPLVDGQGNFGNIDGDSAAAFRYTEARLTPAAMLLLEGLDEDAVDFRETYDGQNREPVVLAAGFPNSAGEWRLRYRGRHGVLGAAAQRSRVHRCGCPPARPSQGDGRRSDGHYAGAGLPDRRRHRRVEGVIA